MFLDGHGYLAIAERLTADQIPPPSGHDRARNPHRLGLAWSKSAVRAILANPRYTGYQVWNKQRRDEVLLDVDDVAAGHISKMRWNPKQQWVWSAEPTHQALVSRETFDQVQARIAARSPTSPRAAATSPEAVCAAGPAGLWAVPAAPAGPVGQRRGLLPLPLPHRIRPKRRL
jgi:site-specific DNA recombinase